MEAKNVVIHPEMEISISRITISIWELVAILVVLILITTGVATLAFYGGRMTAGNSRIIFQRPDIKLEPRIDITVPDREATINVTIPERETKVEVNPNFYPEFDIVTPDNIINIRNEMPDTITIKATQDTTSPLVLHQETKEDIDEFGKLIPPPKDYVPGVQGRELPKSPTRE